MKKQLFMLLLICLISFFSCKKDNMTPNSTSNNASGNTVKDIDGNAYNIVTIGTQVWMKENLKVSKFNDSTAIPLVADEKAWPALTSPGYCWYDNDQAVNGNTYGTLYNWHTVNTKKLCPTGWHVPSDSEWTSLSTYLGGLNVTGGKLKETGTKHWKGSNTGATNETGFTALPGGDRNAPGSFYSIGFYGHWWSSSSDGSPDWALARAMTYNGSDISRVSLPMKSGFSVRCIRN